MEPQRVSTQEWAVQKLDQREKDQKESKESQKGTKQVVRTGSASLCFWCGDNHDSSIFFLLLFLAVLSLHCCAGFSLAGVSGGYSPVAVHGFLTEAASLVMEHSL